MKTIIASCLRVGFLSLSLFAILCGKALGDDPRDAAVTQDMERMKAAMTSQDYATLVDMMYEPIVKLGGGKETMTTQAKKVASKVTFDTFTTSLPYTYASGTTNDYVIVKTHMTLSANGHHFDSLSFELGIKLHQNGKWEYVDGAGIKPELRERFFPDLPKDTVLPEVKSKQLD